MAQAAVLSEHALSLLRRRLSGQRVEVSPENQDAYRELAEAGLAEAVHTFTRGRDSHYRLSLDAMNRKAEFLSVSTLGPSHEGSGASPR
jgi:hypothetical protein